MKVILFGASGMVGQGVLRECLRSPVVARVLVVGRAPLSLPASEAGAKVEQLVHHDFTDFSSIAARLAGFDACFFCLGVSSVGMSEADYRRVTFDITIAAAEALHATTPGLTFIYVSGAGTDSTGRGRSMWARVKGETENRLLALFPSAYMFRPGYIQPLEGVRSKTRFYRAVYAVMAPLFPLWRTLFPRAVTTTVEVGRAMIRVAQHGVAGGVDGGAELRLIENADIVRLGARAANA